MTPAELFTKEFMELMEAEANRADKDIESALMEAAKVLIALYIGRTSINGLNFQLTKGSKPVLEALRKNLRSISEKYYNNAIQYSKAKNTKILNAVIPTPELKGWLDRKIQNRTLNNRIDQITRAFSMEIEARIAMGLIKGEKEAAIIQSVQRYLERPYDNLTVGVRADYKARRLAVKYNSGTGTYKSSYANAKRLVRSEMFEAYRRADYLIWKSSDRVMGVLVYENPLHPEPDTCDDLWGAYPKGYFFTGFHPACICLSRPYLRGENITKMPDNFGAFLDKLKPESSIWKLPFITENKKYWK